MRLPNVIAITATKNRHRHLEKLVKCFLDQDYEGEHTLLIYNNSDKVLKLDNISTSLNKHLILINNSKKLHENRPYNNLGEIYCDILEYAEGNYDVLTHMDDDDIFLPYHISEGVKGLKGYKAYKPAKSFYKDERGVYLAENVLEPSIFVEFEHIKKYGYYSRNVDLHHKWLIPLIDEKQILSDPQGKPTFIYDWSGMIPTFKTSGNPEEVTNFANYNRESQDVGDGIITPLSNESIKKYYKCN